MIRHTHDNQGERRHHPRFEACAAVTLRTADRRCIRGRLINLSAGGASVELEYNDDHVAEGDLLHLLIESQCSVTDFARFQTLTATACRADPHGPQRIGLRFTRTRHELDPAHAPVAADAAAD